MSIVTLKNFIRNKAEGRNRRLKKRFKNHVLEFSVLGFPNPRRLSYNVWFYILRETMRYENIYHKSVESGYYYE